MFLFSSVQQRPVTRPAAREARKVTRSLCLGSGRVEQAQEAATMIRQPANTEAKLDEKLRIRIFRENVMRKTSHLMCSSVSRKVLIKSSSLEVWPPPISMISTSADDGESSFRAMRAPLLIHSNNATKCGTRITTHDIRSEDIFKKKHINCTAN